MDFGKAFSYVFEDENWVTKVLIGAGMFLLGFLIIPLLIVVGYGVRVTRNVIEGAEKPLPDWDDWGGFIKDGLMMAIIFIGYAIPIFLLMILGGVFSALGNRGGAAAIFALIGFLFSCIQFIYSIALALILPGIVGRYAATGEIGAAFAVGEIFQSFKENVGLYLMAFVVYLVAQIVGSLGMIACGIGVLFTAFYSQLIVAHAYGQVYREAFGGGGTIEPAAEAPSL